MTSTLSELCNNIQKCTEKLEEEMKKNIDECHKHLLTNQATEVTLALEKAKDYHYKEILDFLKDIVTNIKKIIFHEEKIRSLNDENSLSLDELKRYSHVQRQISIFSNSSETNMKREKRRVASEISIGSLEAWEQYLEKKSEEENVVRPEKSEIQKRKRPNSKRRKKKFVSSTFNDFLDDSNGKKLDSILEIDDAKDITEDFVVVSTDVSGLESIGENNYDSGLKSNNPLEKLLSDVDKISFGTREDKEDTVNKASNEGSSVSQVVDCVNRECFEGRVDSKPKIVDVVYKKRQK